MVNNIFLRRIRSEVVTPQKVPGSIPGSAVEFSLVSVSLVHALSYFVFGIGLCTLMTTGQERLSTYGVHINKKF
jgi:hypothetical protein